MDRIFVTALLVSLIAPLTSHGQAAEARTLDFRNLNKCYQALRHRPPRQNALSSLPTIRFVEQQQVKKGASPHSTNSVGVTVNALVIQQPDTRRPGNTQVTVIQQRPFAQPGLKDKILGKLINKLFVQKDEFISQTVSIKNKRITNADCGTNLKNQIQIPVARTCEGKPDSCGGVVLNLGSELKTVNGSRVPSPCAPQVKFSNTPLSEQPVNHEEIESRAKKAIAAHLNYMADHYNDIIETIGGSLAGAYTSEPNNPDKNPAIMEARRFIRDLKTSLKADHPVGACNKIFIEPDPAFQQAARGLYCKTVRGTAEACKDGGNAPGTSSEIEL